MDSRSRSAAAPALPTAITMRPQFGSSPAIAVFTSGELATDSAILRASAALAAPVTTTSTNLVAPSYREAEGAAYMKRAELVVGIDLGLGSGAATIWTCDLTHGYIEINADYRS